MTFNAPFRISAFDDPLPPGTYPVETEEQAVEGNERTVYVRVATLLRVSTGGMIQTLTIDPAELDAALAADRAGDQAP